MGRPKNLFGNSKQNQEREVDIIPHLEDKIN